MDTVPKDYKWYIDRAEMLGELRDAHFDVDRFTPGKPYADERTEAWHGWWVARSGWTVVKRIDDFEPFNAIIKIQATMATSGKDGGWEKVTGARRSRVRDISWPS